MEYEIKNRFTGEVQFVAEIDCDETASVGFKLRLSVEWAIINRANLFRADLSGADLSGVNLSGVNLSGADLSGVNLSGADLSGANLYGANLSGANLFRANLYGASHIIDAGTPDKWRCFGWIRDGRLSVRVGCRDKRLDEGRKYWKGKDDRREVMAALDYVEAIAKLRGWKI